MASSMMFIDRTPPTYDGSQNNFNSEVTSFLNYITEIVNFNASQGNKTTATEEGGE